MDNATNLHIEETAKAPKGKTSQILIFNWLYSTEAFWDVNMGKQLFFCFCYFFMFILLQTSELFSLGSIGLSPLKLFTPHNMDYECIIHIYVPSEAILKKIFWLHFQKLITDKWTRPFLISPNFLMLQETKYIF